MNKLTIIIFLFLGLTACGGGSGETQEPEPTPPTPTPTEQLIVYDYIVSSESDTRSYQGRGVAINGIIYASPKSVSSSSYTVTAQIEGDKVRLFSYVTRGLVLEFENGDTSGYTLELTEVKVIQPFNISAVGSVLYNSSSAGAFGETIMNLSNDSGILTGDDTNGCIVSGEIYKTDSSNGIDLVLTDCGQAGEYFGSVRLEGDRLIGVATSENHGININYSF